MSSSSIFTSISRRNTLSSKKVITRLLKKNVSTWSPLATLFNAKPARKLSLNLENVVSHHYTVPTLVVLTLWYVCDIHSLQMKLRKRIQTVSVKWLLLCFKRRKILLKIVKISVYFSSFFKNAVFALKFSHLYKDFFTPRAKDHVLKLFSHP